MDEKVDIAVIGAGVVGAAVARRFALGGKSVALLEKGPRIAEGVTSRNSGVIHAGLYYPKGSLKAQACLRGNQLLYEFCEKRGVPYKKLGKLVVALADSQRDQLESFFRSASDCGAKDLRLLSKRELRAKEPGVSGIAALLSPSTGIVDPYELTRALVQDMEDAGGFLVCEAAVNAVESRREGFSLQSSRGAILAAKVVNCSGLEADRIASLAGCFQYKLYPCRGDYFRFRPTQQFRHLIYPLKVPGSPGLGIHLTIDLAGSYRLGPDAEYVESRDDFSGRESKIEAFRKAAEALFGPVFKEQLQYDTCGIRPKLKPPGEPDERDFVISQDLPGWINCVGIESPGLTSALALAELVERL